MDRPPASSPEASKKNKSSKKKKNKKNKGDNNKKNGDTNQPTPPRAQSLDLKSPTPAAPAKTQDADIDDAASNSSFESISSHRRRRARGGRKKKSQLQIVSEDQQTAQGNNGDGPSDRLENNSWAPEQQLNGQVDGASTSSATVRDEQQEERNQAKIEPENSRSMTNGTQEPDPTRPKKSDTGVKAFNIRKANPDGGKPVAPKIQMSGGGGQSSATGEQSQQNQGGVPSTQAASGETTQSGQGSEERNVSIKVDLNLEVEIFLKAKIKGEVMLTFLN